MIVEETFLEISDIFGDIRSAEADRHQRGQSSAMSEGHVTGQQAGRPSGPCPISPGRDIRTGRKARPLVSRRFAAGRRVGRDASSGSSTKVLPESQRIGRRRGQELSREASQRAPLGQGHSRAPAWGASHPARRVSRPDWPPGDRSELGEEYPIYTQCHIE